MRKQIYRSSITGKIVTEKFAKQNPDTTTKETLCDLRSELINGIQYYLETYSKRHLHIDEIVDMYLNQK